jgi:glycosyltransferase involved in cell wall biosynthesis
MNNILHIIWDGDLGGVQNYVKQVVSSELWADHKHTIFICTNEGAMINSQAIDGVDVISCDCKNARSLIHFNRRLNQVIEEWNINIIHAHCDSLLFLSQIRLFKKCKLIYTEHGDTQVRENRKVMRDAIWKVNGGQWDHIILNSNFTREKFLGQFPQFEKNSVLITNPLLTGLKRRLPRKMTRPFKFGAVGRLETVKGLDSLLLAAANLSKKYPDSEFHLYGEGSQEAYLKTMADQLQITNIKFHGYTINPLKDMSELDCLVVPSKLESFGLSALESLSVGTPVIAFQGTGIADFLKHNKHGYLAKKGSVESLHNCMEKIMSDENQWNLFSQEGISMVKEDYSMESHITQLAELYSSHSEVSRN